MSERASRWSCDSGRGRNRQTLLAAGILRGPHLLPCSSIAIVDKRHLVDTGKMQKSLGVVKGLVVVFLWRRRSMERMAHVLNGYW